MTCGFESTPGSAQTDSTRLEWCDRKSDPSRYKPILHRVWRRTLWPARVPSSCPGSRPSDLPQNGGGVWGTRADCRAHNSAGQYGRPPWPLPSCSHSPPGNRQCAAIRLAPSGWPCVGPSRRRSVGIQRPKRRHRKSQHCHSWLMWKGRHTLSTKGVEKSAPST